MLVISIEFKENNEIFRLSVKWSIIGQSMMLN